MVKLKLINGINVQKTLISLLSLTLWLTYPAMVRGQVNNFAPVVGGDQLLPETPYTLGAGDRIQVTIYQVEEFSGPHLVLVDGTVSFPLLGSIKVEGMTLEELNAILTQQYAAYIKRPVITTSLIEPRPVRVTIAGEVNSPGAYTLPFSQGKYPTVTDLVQLAGGITAAADIKTVKIRRFFGNTQQMIEVSLWEILRSADQSSNITLRDRDAIVIPTALAPDPIEARQLADANFGIRADQELNIAVVGEVFRPGSYKLSPTRASGQDDETKQQPPRLTNAIQAAGGIKKLANIREIELRRYPRTGENQIFVVDLWNLLTTGNLDEDIILQDGDTIVVPKADQVLPEESETLAAASFAPSTITINVVGEVISPGAKELPPNTPLNQAILAAGGFNKRRAKQKTIELIRLNDNGTVTKRDISVDLAQGITSENNPVLQNKDVIVVNRSGLTAASDTLVEAFRPIGTLSGFFGFLNIFGVFDND